VLPETLARFGTNRWVNAEAIGLDPDRWERDGLFAPKTPARDYSALEAEIGGLLTRKPEAELAAV
jgi:hypothetical protein